MAKSVLDIVIRTIKEGGGDKQVIDSLVNVKGMAQTAGIAFAALAGATYAVDKALDATAGKFVDYASEVRAVQFATGATAEESSRLIQVADDMKVSYETLSKAMNKAVKEGVTPNIDGLAQLSDQYLALAPGAERAAFLLDKFGKSGADMAELMSQGGDSIREMSAGIDESLVISQEAVDQARELEMAQDALNEQWETFALNVGQQVVPALTQLVEGMNIYLDLAKSEEETYTRAAIYHNAVDMAMQKQAESSRVLKDDLMQETGAMQQNTQAVQEAQVNYTALVGMMQQLNNATAQEIKNTAYKQLQNELQQSGNELTADEADLLKQAGIEMGIFSQKSADQAEQITELNEQLADGVISLDTYIAKLNEIPDTVTTDVILNTPSGGGGGGPIPQAIGGQQRAGKPYLVHQDEIIVPATNGYTLTRTDALNIAKGPAGGSGGRTVNVYGAVTVVTQGSAADALESLR